MPAVSTTPTVVGPDGAAAWLVMYPRNRGPRAICWFPSAKRITSSDMGYPPTLAQSPLPETMISVMEAAVAAASLLCPSTSSDGTAPPEPPTRTVTLCVLSYRTTAT